MALAASQAANLAKIKALSARLTGRDSGPSPVFAAASPTTASSSFAVPARTQENHAQAAMFRPSPQAPTPAATSYSATASQTSRMTTQNNNYSLHSTSSLAPSSLRGSSVSGSSVTDSPPVKTQSDGPSLLGSADQLAAARAFSSTATSAGNKSRPGRERLVSHGPSATSSRPSASRAFALPPMLHNNPPPISRSTPYAYTAMRSQAGPSSPSSTSTLPSSRPTATPAPTTLTTPARPSVPTSTAATSPPSSSAVKPTSTKPARVKTTTAPQSSQSTYVQPTVEDDGVQEITQGMKKVQVSTDGNNGVSAPQPTSSTPTVTTTQATSNIIAPQPTASTPTAKTAAARRFADITNTLRDNAREAQRPAKGLSFANPAAPEAAESTNSVNGDMSAASHAPALKAQLASIGSKSTGFFGTPAPSTTTAPATQDLQTETQQPRADKGKGRETAMPAEPTINGHVTSMNHDKPAAAMPSGDASGTYDSGTSSSNNIFGIDASEKDRIIKLLRDQLSTKQAQETSLRATVVELRKTILAMKEAEERRKYLGTNSAHVPFNITVVIPLGTLGDVQVSRAMTVAALINCVKVKMGLKLVRSMRPRIEVNGEEVGHMMTLGELGVLDGTANVRFVYDA